MASALGLCQKANDTGNRLPGVSDSRAVALPLNFDQPYIFYLGGAGTNDPHYGISGIKRLETALKGRQIGMNQIKIIGCYYQRFLEEYTVWARRFINERRGWQSEKNYDADEKKQYGNLFDSIVYPVHVRQFYAECLFPCFVQNPDQRTIIHKRLSVEQAARNLRKIHLVAHSYGGVILETVGDMMAEHMAQIGYKPDEIDFLQRQVFALTMGSVIAYGQSRFNTVHLMSRLDQHVADELIPSSWNAFLSREISPETDLCTVIYASNHERIIIADKLCQKSTQLDSCIEHDLLYYMLPQYRQEEGAFGKTKSAMYMTNWGYDYLAAAVQNAVNNQHQTSFIPLDQALKTIKSDSLNEAVRRGRFEKNQYDKPNQNPASHHLDVGQSILGQGNRICTHAWGPTVFPNKNECNSRPF